MDSSAAEITGNGVRKVNTEKKGKILKMVQSLETKQEGVSITKLDPRDRRQVIDFFSY